MTGSSSTPCGERITEGMIQLARAAKWQGVIVGGHASFDIFLDLHRRGYVRAATMRTSRLPCGQYHVALLAWREHSFKGLEATLARLVAFLNTTGVLVVWVNLKEPTPRMLALILERLGFRIEAGTVCENGIAVVARRLESNPAVAPAAKVA